VGGGVLVGVAGENQLVERESTDERLPRLRRLPPFLRGGLFDVSARWSARAPFPSHLGCKALSVRM